MKFTVVIFLIFLYCLPSLDLQAQDEPNVDVALNRLIQKAQREAQRDVIRLAARPMFNNLNDWQRWENQLNAMQPHQLNGLMNILNAPQRQMLAQRQQWLSQLLHRQWLEQQLQEEFQNLLRSLASRAVNLKKLGFKVSFGLVLFAISSLPPTYKKFQPKPQKNKDSQK